jgi:long-subunit fatty acid transport protein
LTLNCHSVKTDIEKSGLFKSKMAQRTMESPAALKRLARRRGGFPGSGEPIMIIRYRRLSLAFTLASAAVSGQALAGAFQLQEQSVSGQGTSWAGRASNVQDATIVFGNPAGMSFLDRAQLTAGTHYIDASSDIHDESGNQPMVTGVDGNGTPIIGSVATGGGSDGDMIPQKAIPFGYVTIQVAADGMSPTT